MKTLYVKRVYAPPAKEDGLRVLVDRLWPRGLTKEKAEVDLWLRDIAPSDDLRRKFHAKPELWPEFKKAYMQELKHAKEPVEILLGKLATMSVTLLYAAHDEEHNNAVALREWLLKQTKSKG